MESRLGDRRFPDRQDIRSNATSRGIVNVAVERVEVPMRGTTSVIQEDIGQSLNGRKDLSGSDAFVQPGLVLLSQEAVVYVRIRSQTLRGSQEGYDILREKLAFGQ